MPAASAVSRARHDAAEATPSEMFGMWLPMALSLIVVAAWRWRAAGTWYTA